MDILSGSRNHMLTYHDLSINALSYTAFCITEHEDMYQDTFLHTSYNIFI